MELKNLQIDKIIIHQVYKRDEKGNIVKPYLSKKLTTLDSEGMSQFISRIIESCGDDTHSAEMDIVKDDNESSFQKSINLMYITKDSEYIEKSEFFSFKLADAQNTRRYSDCLIVVFKGTVGINNLGIVGILKAEPQGGFRSLEKDTSIFLEYLKDLVLTPANKFYKLGIFIEKSEGKKTQPFNKKDFMSLVYDHKLTEKETRLGARYFYETFLGLSFSLSDKKLTQDFYESTKDFINKEITDQDKRMDLLGSLYTYMKVDQRSTISINDFATNYIDQELRDKYSNKMKKDKVPGRSINKDISYIASKLKRRSLRFNTKVSIYAPAEEFDTLIKITSSSEDNTTVTIKGKIDTAR